MSFDSSFTQKLETEKIASYPTFVSSRTEQMWHLEDRIPFKSVGMIYGDAGCGKSHLMLALGSYFASDSKKFLDLNVGSGSVLFCLGEGSESVKVRMPGIIQEHQLQNFEDSMFFCDSVMDLARDQGLSNFEDMIEAMLCKPKIIFIDTFSRYFSSVDENNNSEITKAFNGLERIKNKFGCTIILIHHKGKGGGKEARGASAINACLDFSFSMSKYKNGKISFKCEKQKGGSDQVEALDFVLKDVSYLWGACEIQTVCLVKGQTSINGFVFTDDEQLALNTFDRIRPTWRQNFLNALPKDLEILVESKKVNFNRAVKKLIAKGLVIETPSKDYQLMDTMLKT